MSRPFGLENGGNNCYFNSLIQGMLSCEPFYKLIMEKKPTSGVGGAIYRLCMGITSSVSEIKRELSRYKSIYQGNAQECAFETYDFLIESMKDIGVPKLFTNRIRRTITCTCGHITKVPIESPYFILFVNKRHHSSLLGALNEVESLPDYKCDKCHMFGTSKSISAVSMVPEILTIVLAQYTSAGKHIFALEDIIRIPKKPDGEFVYKKIASLEHYGSNGGGHYTCVAERNGISYVFNDLSVGSSSLSNTSNSYILFYTT